jgi:hypothetical protein
MVWEGERIQEGCHSDSGIPSILFILSKYFSPGFV